MTLKLAFICTVTAYPLTCYNTLLVLSLRSTLVFPSPFSCKTEGRIGLLICFPFSPWLSQWSLLNSKTLASCLTPSQFHFSLLHSISIEEREQRLFFIGIFFPLWFSGIEQQEAQKEYQEPKLAHMDPLVFWMAVYFIQETINQITVWKKYHTSVTIFWKIRFPKWHAKSNAMHS